MRVVVTGGAGFIGSHLCDRLVAAGAEVTAVDSFDDFYAPALKHENLAALRGHPRFRLVVADVREAAALERAMAGDGREAPDMLVHLAARAGVRASLADPALYARVNVEGTATVLEACRRLGVGRLVFGSSSSVYGNSERVPFSEGDPAGDPISPYAATKRAGELLCRSFAHLYGIATVCVRLFTVYGPRQRPDLAIHRFSRLMAAGEAVPLFGDGTMERDYTYVDDVVDGVMGAIALTGTASGPLFEIVNLGGNRTTTTTRLIELIARELDVSPRIDHLPAQPGDVLRTYADVEKAGRLLGYRPAVPIEEGIPRFVEWFRTAGAPLPAGAAAR